MAPNEAKFVFPGAQATFKGEFRCQKQLQTPSLVETGLSWHAERGFRFWTCIFLQDLASQANLPDAPLIAAQLLVQRFYMLHPFNEHDRFYVATAALFLCAKAEEFPVKVRILTELALFLTKSSHAPRKDDSKDKSKEENRESRRKLIGVRKRHQSGVLRQKRDHAGTLSGNNRLPCRNASGSQPSTIRYGPYSSTTNTRKRGTVREIDLDSERKQKRLRQERVQLDCLNALLEVVDVGFIEKAVKNVLLYERILLQTLEFQVGIPWPQNSLFRFLSRVLQLEALELDEKDRMRILDLAWMILSDSIRAGLCLTFDCHQLAAGSTYLSCLFCNYVHKNVTTEDDQPWWSVFGYTADELEGIARSLVVMFGDEQGKTRKGLPPRFGALRERWRPQDNMPDLELVRRMDADVVKHQGE